MRGMRMMVYMVNLRCICSIHVVQVVFVLNDCILVVLEICRVSNIMPIHFCCLSRLYDIMFTTLLFFFLYVCVPLLVASLA